MIFIGVGVFVRNYQCHLLLKDNPSKWSFRRPSTFIIQVCQLSPLLRAYQTRVLRAIPILQTPGPVPLPAPSDDSITDYELLKKSSALFYGSRKMCRGPDRTVLDYVSSIRGHQCFWIRWKVVTNRIPLTKTHFSSGWLFGVVIKNAHSL